MWQKHREQNNPDSWAKDRPVPVGLLFPSLGPSENNTRLMDTISITQRKL